MADDSTKWTGDFNPRGASVILTNAAGNSFTYYAILIDFPSTFTLPDSPFSFTEVKQISTIPSKLVYDTSVNYKKKDYTLVNYQDMYYRCIKDTSGNFDAKCWQSVGANGYKLKYSFNNTDWPSAKDATVVSYLLPLFTTNSAYTPSDGPIVDLEIKCSGNSESKSGDPNHRKPPVINLELSTHNGGQPGVPVQVIFSSATYFTGLNYWILVLVNSGSSNYFNQYTFTEGAGNTYNGNLVSGSGNSSAVAAIGFINCDASSQPVSVSIDNGTAEAVANPMTSNQYYFTL